LNFPKNHKFVEGKPDIKEKITDITPVYSKIGPLFKKESKKINQWIKEHQEELIKKIVDIGDIKWSDISPANTKKTEELLIENGFIQVKKETKVKGMESRSILKFDDFYLEVSGDLIK